MPAQANANVVALQLKGATKCHCSTSAIGADVVYRTWISVGPPEMVGS